MEFGDFTFDNAADINRVNHEGYKNVTFLQKQKAFNECKVISIFYFFF